MICLLSCYAANHQPSGYRFIFRDKIEVRGSRTAVQGHMLLLVTFVHMLISMTRSQGMGPLLSPYQQKMVTRHTYSHLPRLADWPALPSSITTAHHFTSLQDGDFHFLTADRLYRYTNGAFVERTHLYPGLRISALSALLLYSDTLNRPVTTLADPNGIHFCLTPYEPCVNLLIPMGHVHDLAYDPVNDRFLVAAANGLFLFQGSAPYSLQHKAVLGGGPVVSVAVDPKTGTIAAATKNRLWRTLVPGDVHTFHFFWIGGLVDSTPKDLAFDLRGFLWIVNNVCVNRQAPDLTFLRIAGNQGLPAANLTRVAVDYTNNDVWFGGLRGAVRFEQSESKWHYYYGPSTLPGPSTTVGQNVSEIISFGAQGGVPTTAIATDGGISIISFKTMTLEDKAVELEKLMKYFQSPSKDPHPYAGYLVGDIGLTYFGNFSSWVPQSNDNNGLWTSIYLAGECFRYALTRDPAVKANAWKYFEGMEFLNNVTGIHGLMARSVLYQNTFPPQGTWHKSPVYPGWIWKGDTSSDELVGHMMAYPIVYHLLAETPQEKARAYRLIDGIMRYIIDNNYQLIDVTGKPTTVSFTQSCSC